jgi:hypothetical protein
MRCKHPENRVAFGTPTAHQQIPALDPSAALLAIDGDDAVTRLETTGIGTTAWAHIVKNQRLLR